MVSYWFTQKNSKLALYKIVSFNFCGRGKMFFVLKRVSNVTWWNFENFLPRWPWKHLKSGYFVVIDEMLPQ